jgi:hypothetical protein
VLRQAVLDAIRAHCPDGPADDDRTLVICERIADV